MATTLIIGHRRYTLPEDIDQPALQVELCDAVRRGSGIVTFTTEHHGQVTVVVSPGVTIAFEPAPEHEPATGHALTGPIHLDWDLT